MRVICITGKAGHGKDTVASLLRDEFIARGQAVLITHFADLVKYVCRTFLDWDGEKDEYGRSLLQHVGTEDFRAYRADYWVGFIIDVLKIYPYRWDWVIIPDWRFPNEAGELINAGFDVRLLRVIRENSECEMLEEQRKHASENSLDGHRVDYTIHNDSDLDALAGRVKAFLLTASDDTFS